MNNFAAVDLRGHPYTTLFCLGFVLCFFISFCFLFLFLFFLGIQNKKKKNPENK